MLEIRAPAHCGKLPGERRRAVAILAGEQDVDGDDARRIRRRVLHQAGDQAAPPRPGADPGKALAVDVDDGDRCRPRRSGEELAHGLEGGFSRFRDQASGIAEPKRCRRRDGDDPPRPLAI